VSKHFLISIVDNDPSVREGTKDLVEAMGFAAESFECADDFLKSNVLHSTSCLILDVQMPGMDGFELRNRLASFAKAIPTIFITAFPEQRDRARALRTGAVCYLSKPFKERELLACIQAALRYWKADTRAS